jgi:hypothetical protein
MLTPKELSKLIDFHKPEEYPVMTNGEINLIIDDHSYLSTRAENCIMGEAMRLGAYDGGILLVRHIVYVMALHGSDSVREIEGFGPKSYCEVLDYLGKAFGRVENLDAAMRLSVKHLEVLKSNNDKIKEAFRLIAETVSGGELYDNGDIVFSVCGEKVGALSISKDSILRLINNALNRQFNEVGYN